MTRRTLLAFATASFLLLSATGSSAQSEPPRHPPAPKILGPGPWKTAPQEISASYWTLEPGWNTELEMRNNVVQHELTITPALRLATGKEIAIAPVTLAAGEGTSVNLRDALSQADPGLIGRAESFGSVVFRFASPSSGNAFAATIVRREGHPIDFHFDADDGGSGDSGGFEGIWWLPADTATDYLILSNPSSKPVKTNLILSDSTGAAHRFPVTVAAGQTQRTDIREVMRASAGAIGGLSLSFPDKGELSATEIVFDEVTGLAAILKLFERDPSDKAKTHELLAPMIALSQPDPGLGFPNGTTLSPLIFLRNAGAAPMAISTLANWRNQSAQGKFVLPRIALNPGQMTILNLSDFLKPGEISPDANWATITLNYSGRRSDLVAVALSYDKAHRYGLQTPFSEGLSHKWAGGMWHVDPTHNTFITTGNGGSEPTMAEVTLFYNGGKDRYQVQRLLQPGELIWLDVGKLVREQIPDRNGHTIPPEVTMGPYELNDLDHPLVGLLYEGKLVIDKTYGHASYGCEGCCGYLDPSFNPTSFGAPPGIDYPEDVQTFDACSDQFVDITGDMYNWASSDTSVATLPNPTLHTVAVGSATGSAQATLQIFNIKENCPQEERQGNQPISVQVPTDQTIVQTLSGQNYAINTTTTPACPSGQAGWYRRVQKIVIDQTGADITVNGATISESLGAPSPNGLNLAQPTPFAPVQTANGGYFDDQFAFCSPLCPGSTSYSNLTETLTDQPPTGGNYTLKTHTLKYTCTGNTDNGN